MIAFEKTGSNPETEKRTNEILNGNLAVMTETARSMLLLRPDETIPALFEESPPSQTRALDEVCSLYEKLSADETAVLAENEDLLLGAIFERFAERTALA